MRVLQGRQMSDALALLLGLVTIGSAIAGAAWILATRLKGVDDRLDVHCNRLQRIERHLELNGNH